MQLQVISNTFLFKFICIHCILLKFWMLFRVINFPFVVFSEASKPVLDEVSVLTAITLFLWSASTEIIGVQSLQNGCINRFKNALNSSDPWVRSWYRNLNDMQLEKIVFVIYLLCFLNVLWWFYFRDKSCLSK